MKNFVIGAQLYSVRTLVQDAEGLKNTYSRPNNICLPFQKDILLLLFAYSARHSAGPFPVYHFHTAK